jgi:hypothetical protein
MDYYFLPQKSQKESRREFQDQQLAVKDIHNVEEQKPEDAIGQLWNEL